MFGTVFSKSEGKKEGKKAKKININVSQMESKRVQMIFHIHYMFLDSLRVLWLRKEENSHAHISLPSWTI